MNIYRKCPNRWTKKYLNNCGGASLLGRQAEPNQFLFRSDQNGVPYVPPNGIKIVNCFIWSSYYIKHSFFCLELKISVITNLIVFSLQKKLNIGPRIGQAIFLPLLTPLKSESLESRSAAARKTLKENVRGVVNNYVN